MQLVETVMPEEKKSEDDTSDETSEEASYVPVTDEKELEALMKIFTEMLDDADLTM